MLRLRLRSTVTHSLPCARRHRAFLARLRGGVRDERCSAPLLRIFRRSALSLITRLLVPLHFAVVINRPGVVPWPQFQRRPDPGSQPSGAPSGRERVTLVARLAECRTQLLWFSRIQLIERLLPAATTRIDATMTRLVNHLQVNRSTAYPRVALTIVRQQGVAVTPATGLTATLAPQAAPAWQPVSPRAAVSLPPTTLPPQELLRVTDHVLQQFDHRVRSYRERMGLV